jgi:hypothetical protein
MRYRRACQGSSPVALALPEPTDGSCPEPEPTATVCFCVDFLPAGPHFAMISDVREQSAGH